MPGNAAFHPTIETVGFQTAFSVNLMQDGEYTGQYSRVFIGVLIHFRLVQRLPGSGMYHPPVHVVLTIHVIFTHMGLNTCYWFQRLQS
jgi:hypothetical protein